MNTLNIFFGSFLVSCGGSGVVLLLWARHLLARNIRHIAENCDVLEKYGEDVTHTRMDIIEKSNLSLFFTTVGLVAFVFFLLFGSILLLDLK